MSTGQIKSLKAESTLFTSSKEAEDLFSSSLEEFAKELKEADALLALETTMKKEALLALYQESEDALEGQETGLNSSGLDFEASITSSIRVYI